MTRATISTGGILFKKSDDDIPEQPVQSDDAPMHIALIGDFSGRRSRGVNESEALASRKLYEIDRDNFEEIFEELNVSLKLPISDEPINFSEFDDLDPDYLYEKLPLFEDLKVLKRRLNKKEYFDSAADEIRNWKGVNISSENTLSAENSADQANPEPVKISGNMLDAVLSQSTESLEQLNSLEGNINSLIKDVVAPYVQEKADPRLPEYLEAVDLATTEALRKIMHASEFQTLEASWRAVYFLVRKIETNRNLKLFLVDVSCDEMASDIQSSGGDIAATGLYKLLVEKRQGPGGIPFSIINGDFEIQDNLTDISIASVLGQIASEINATAFVGGAPSLYGCQSLEKYQDPDDWSYDLESAVQELWNDFRELESAQHIGVVGPRFLLRLPYGKATSPVESFKFEELPPAESHEYYLWGSSAYLATLLMANAYTMRGWHFAPGVVNEVDDLPLHAYSRDGESFITPCAEIYTIDRAAQEMINAGILPVRSVKNSVSVLIPEFVSVHTSKTLKGRWQKG